ncbi:hypothetical protein NDU88_000247 [Pleurodeles waltl]|uniref:Uncharacterized protein n=1 Tax=Pleurodeles waltl TaxID=8319 RepID=A0AAV7KMH9_PLEWA|nr:hypothetical protein NDU88_000247 [Pleurodeles waltl]
MGVGRVFRRRASRGVGAEVSQQGACVGPTFTVGPDPYLRAPPRRLALLYLHAAAGPALQPAIVLIPVPVLRFGA